MEDARARCEWSLTANQHKSNLISCRCQINIRRCRSSRFAQIGHFILCPHDGDVNGPVCVSSFSRHDTHEVCHRTHTPTHTPTKRQESLCSLVANSRDSWLRSGSGAEAGIDCCGVITAGWVETVINTQTFTSPLFANCISALIICLYKQAMCHLQSIY